MRILSEIELTFVSGGDGTDSGGDVVVTAPSSGVDYFPSPGQSPTGQGNRGPVQANQPHTTPFGHVYKAGINLSSIQTANLDRIVDYGFSKGQSETAAVAALAFAESSLDNSKVNGSHQGLGQYNSTEWSARGETGSISNANDQVKALFHDYEYYAQRYQEAVSTNAAGINDAHVSQLEYYEIKHHAGSNATNWDVVDGESHITYRQEILNANDKVRLSFWH